MAGVHARVAAGQQDLRGQSLGRRLPAGPLAQPLPRLVHPKHVPARCLPHTFGRRRRVARSRPPAITMGRRSCAPGTVPASVVRPQRRRAALPDRCFRRRVQRAAEAGSAAWMEVVLVVAPKGVFLVEIKSWPGVLEGRCRHVAAHEARANAGRNHGQLRRTFPRPESARGTDWHLSPEQVAAARTWRSAAPSGESYRRPSVAAPGPRLSPGIGRGLRHRPL